MKAGSDISKHDISTLRFIAGVGEPLNQRLWYGAMKIMAYQFMITGGKLKQEQ